MLSCLSPNGSTLVTGDALPDHLVVATLEGLVTAAREGNGFRVVARALTDRHVSSLWYEPSADVLFAASYQGGVFASTDGGLTFASLGSKLEERNVYCVAARTTSDGLVLYAGTEPVGLLVSTDRGATWRELSGIAEMPNREHWTFPGPPHEAHLKNFTFVPDDDSHLFACVEQGGLFESRDGGVSFRELESIELRDDEWYRDVHRMVLRPGEPSTMFFSGGDGLTTSIDGGRSWRRVLPTTYEIGYPDGLVVHPGEPDLMFVSGAHRQPGTWRESHSAHARVARSTDGGSTWSLLSGGLPEPLDANIEALSLAVTPIADELYLGTTDGDVYLSRDRGDSFDLVLSGLAPISKGGHYRGLVRTA